MVNIATKEINTTKDRTTILFDNLSEEYNTTLSLLHIKDDIRILKTMTDEEWQKIFHILKIINIPSCEKKLSRKCGSVRIMNRNWSLTDLELGSDYTQDSYYTIFINDVLRCIRGKCGKGDLIQNCRHIYQIGELLRFEPDLRSRLVHSGGYTYIEVWLDK